MIAALSGGADSVLLTLCLNAAAKSNGFELQALHIHHGLRGNADSDEAFCREFCQQNNIPFEAIRVVVNRNGSLEANARDARYAVFRNQLLNSEKDAVIALAHHMDDQAETILIHMLHGCGTDGLAGMRELNGSYWRPLLNVKRKEIRQALIDLGQSWCEDETNTDLHFTRNRIRHELIPILQSISPKVTENIARNAVFIRDESDYLDSFAKERLKGKVGDIQPFILLEAFDGADTAIRRRMLRLYLHRHGIETTGLQLE